MSDSGSLLSTPATVRQRDPLVRAYPYPASAWLALSSDPDNTVLEDWRELNRVIWDELGLPFGDTAFIQSFNLNLPGQVNLVEHPSILAAHAHDAIHTWGDYMWAGGKGFHRPDAEEALRQLRSLGFKPRVWVDHSYFQGNMLHNGRYGSMPVIEDRSGHAYPNPAYTLDLVREAGVRYVWDGTITPVLGQDRPMSQWKLQRARESSAYTAVLRLAARRLRGFAGAVEQAQDNLAYRPHRFPDGQTFYVFQRHGLWDWADIDGLGRLFAAERMQQLVRTGGTCIAYTHLGKRHASRRNGQQHIPDATMHALRGLRDLHASGVLMLSPVSALLDYLVLRDRMEIDRVGNAVRFVPDGIAFTRIGADDLRGKRFTITGLRLEGLRALGTEGAIPFHAKDHGTDGITLSFD